MKVIGCREVSGTSKESGRAWSGIKLYYTEPVRSGGAGFTCGSAYFGGPHAQVIKDAGGEDFSGIIGCEVTLIYDRWGKAVGLNIMSTPL